MLRRSYINGWEVLKMSDSEVMMRTKMGVKDDPAQVAHVLCTFVHPCAPQSEALVLTLD
jgi:hypothetical protein